MCVPIERDIRTLASEGSFDRIRLRCPERLRKRHSDHIAGNLVDKYHLGLSLPGYKDGVQYGKLVQ